MILERMFIEISVYLFIIRVAFSLLVRFLQRIGLRVFQKKSFSVKQKQPPQVFSKKSGLRNFTKFTGKHLCQSLFFNKVAGLRPLLKKRPWPRCFSVNFVKIFRTPFLQNTPGRLLLVILFSSRFILFSSQYSLQPLSVFLRDETQTFC